MSTITPTRPSMPASAPRPRPPMQPTGAPGIDPFRILRRHLMLFIGTGVVGVALGIVIFLGLNRYFPRYSAEVLFEIRGGLDEADDLKSGVITQDELVMRIATSEAAILVSRTVLEQAVKDPDVRSTTWFRKGFITPDGRDLLDEAVDELEEDVSSRLIRGSNLFGLRWQSGKDSDVPIVLNSIARTYLDKRLAQDTDSYNNSLQVFTAELNQTERTLDDLAQEIDNFIREKGITTLDNPRQSQLAQAIDQLIDRMAETGAGLSMSQTAYAQVAAKLEGTIAPTEEDRRLAAQDPAVRPHEVGVLNTKTALRILRAQYRDPAYWLIRKQEATLRAMELEYDAKLQEIMTSNLQAALRELSKQIESMRNMLDEQEQDLEEKTDLLRRLAADIATYIEMEQQRDYLGRSRDTNIDLIKELRLIRLREESRRVRIAQIALTPRQKAFPKIYIIVPMVTFVLVSGVAGITFLRELTDQRVKTASDLQVRPDARVLGVIPELDDDPCKAEHAERVVCKFPLSVLAESYRQTYTLIDKAVMRAGHQTLLLVSGLPGSGTTTVTTNVAVAAVATGRKVIVIDANFRRPHLAQAMGAEPEGPGLGDVLVNSATLADAIVTTEDGVDLIRAGTQANRMIERLSNGRFGEIVNALKERYDLVLLDAAPIVVAGDALAMAGTLDAAILIVKANSEQRGLVKRLITQLSDAHCELLGMVLNRPRRTAGGYFKKNYAVMVRYATDAT